MRSYAPSFFVLALVLLSSIAFIAVLFFVYTRDAAPEQALETRGTLVAAQANQVSGQLFEADTDGDGLADWEESLWNTDPRVPDTDGDGTNDGAEIQEGRDPLKNAEDDTLVYETDGSAVTEEASTTPFENLTVTEKMGRELFGSYMSHKQHGTFGLETQQDVVNSVLARAQARIQPAQYGIDDIRLYDESSPDVYEAYGTELTMLFAKLTPAEHELILVAKIIDGVDSAAAATKLADRLRKYATLRDDLLDVRVPEGASTAHITLVNALSAHIFNLEALQNPEYDPLRTITAAASYLEVESVLNGAITTLQGVIAQWLV